MNPFVSISYAHGRICASGLMALSMATAMPHAMAATAIKPPAAVSASPVATQQPELKLIPATSQIMFIAKQVGVPMEGQFKRFDAQVNLDPMHPEAGSLQVRIHMASATLSADGETMLQDVAWFNTAKFAQAEFVSRQIKSVGRGKLEVIGNFKLKGVSRELKVPVTLVASGQKWLATGGFTLPRLAYQVGSGEWADTSVVADEVQVKFSWQLQGSKPAK